MSTKPLKSIDIFKYDVPAKTLLNAIKGEVSFSLNMLRKEFHHNISPDTRIVRILTPNECYYYIIESGTNGYNCDKIRQVFNSG